MHNPYNLSHVVCLFELFLYQSRYVVIVHPMKSRTWCTMGNTKKIIAGVWVIAVLLSLPTLHIMVRVNLWSVCIVASFKIDDSFLQDTYTSYYYNSHNSVTLSLCMQSGGTLEERRIIRWYQLLVMFLVPVKVMLFCYSFVIHVLWISTKELAKLTHSNRSVQHQCSMYWIPRWFKMNLWYFYSMEEESKQRLTHSPNRHTNNKTILTRAVKNHSVEVREARKQVRDQLLCSKDHGGKILVAITFIWYIRAYTKGSSPLHLIAACYWKWCTLTVPL